MRIALKASCCGLPGFQRIVIFLTFRCLSYLFTIPSMMPTLTWSKQTSSMYPRKQSGCLSKPRTARTSHTRARWQQTSDRHPDPRHTKSGSGSDHRVYAAVNEVTIVRAKRKNKERNSARSHHWLSVKFEASVPLSASGCWCWVNHRCFPRSSGSQTAPIRSQ